MDEIAFPESYEGVTTDDLTSLRTTANDALLALVEADSPTDEDVDEATRLGAGIDAIDAELAIREEAVAARAEKIAALREKFSEAEPEEEPEEGEVPNVDPDAEPGLVEPEAVLPLPEPDPDAEPAVPNPKAAAIKPTARTTLARRTSRPAPPANTPTPVTITAAADVPDFSTGQRLSDMNEVGTAVVARMRGFGQPSGDGESENLHHYGVAKFAINYPDDLIIPAHGDDMSVLTHAANEHRLPGKSLTAAGGWCAPSETLYDLCVQGETLDGLVSLPEVQVSRGGIRYTKGPDWGALYSAIGFRQTEAQAIAGTAKTCYEVPCPTFQEVRLDAVGVCIKAPILTNAAYPEIVNRIVTGAMAVHAHKVNAATLTSMATAAGTAVTGIDYGATTQSTMASLTYLSDLQRQKYKLGLNDSIEIVAPYWLKGVIREDMAERGGRPIDAITDAYINAEFAARHANVQWVYDWQEMATDTGWPATVNVLMYPAGAFIKGTSDVITMNAVYDSASLVANVYTALFFEEGVLVANLCGEAKLITLAVCASGKTGAQSSTACGTDTTP